MLLFGDPVLYMFSAKKDKQRQRVSGSAGAQQMLAQDNNPHVRMAAAAAIAAAAAGLICSVCVTQA